MSMYNVVYIGEVNYVLAIARERERGGGREREINLINIFWY